MSEIADVSSKDFNEARDILNARFPNIRCLRCDATDFMMDVWTSPVGSSDLAEQRLIELTCVNCGFQEKHMLAGLDRQLDPYVKLRRKRL